MSGKSIKSDIPSTEKNHLPRLENPNEEIQLDFIGPITVDNRRFYILLSMDRFSKWPAASFCTSTDGETAIKFLEQYIQLNGVPKTIRTDKATAFTGRSFRNFCKEHYIKLIYGTPYIHTPTGLVERGVRTLKENLLTNIKAGERFSKALDLSLDVMRKTPHSRLKKSAFELHYGRKPNTEISNLLKLDNLEKLTKNSVSAKPDTLQVYSFNGAGGVSDQLPMKTKKNAKGVSNYPFFFLEKKHQRNKFESAYSDKPQLAVSGTKHTITTPNGRILHRKMISKPISNFNQEQNNRGIGPRGPDGRFITSPSKHRRTTVIESDSESETPLLDTTSPKTPEPQPNTTIKTVTIGRGRPKLVRDRTTPNSPQATTTMGPLTIVTANMTDTEIDRAITDTKNADQELFLRDENGKVLINNSSQNTLEDNFENSDLDLASNLSSSTEIDKEEKEPIRRSKRLTKTNPIIRYNNPICYDYRKHRKQTEFGNTGSTNSTTGGERRRSLDRSDTHIQTLRPIVNRNKQSCQERSTVHQKLDQWRNTRHNKHSSNPIGRSSANSKGGNVEDRQTLTQTN